MTKTTTSAAKPLAEQTVMKALEGKPQATTAEVASTAGVGRSTAGKVLARSEAPVVQRSEGGTRRAPPAT